MKGSFSMRSKIAIIAIIASVFILGVLLANYYKSKPQKSEGLQTAESGQTTAAENLPESVSSEEELLQDDPGQEELSSKPDEEEGSQEENKAGQDNSETETEPVEEPEQKQILPEFDDILPVNPYVAGWLQIDGSMINDPVVYTPKSQNYFLHRAIDGSNESKGTLFIAINWRDGYNNTLIYGHNMKDGSGFGSLQKFAKQSFGKEHPVIRFDTLYEKREYELFAAFYSQIDEEELETEDDRDSKDKKLEEEAIARKEEAGETVTPAELTLNDIDLHRDFGDVDIYREEKDSDNGRFRYYYYTDLSDKADFDYYAENVKARALYDTGVDAEWGDEFITLSTCSYQVKNGRFVVVGVRKRQ